MPTWRKNPPKKKLMQSFRIDEADLAAARALADHRGTSVGLIIRAAVHAYLDDPVNKIGRKRARV